MIQRLLLSCVIICLTFTLGIQSQTIRRATNKDQTVLLQAKTFSVPNPKITISWKKHDLAINYSIQRKGINDLNWSNILATVDSTTTSYDDVNVAQGELYEYKVYANCKGLYSERVNGKDTLILEPFIAFGYICSGVQAVLPEKSKVLLLIDSTFQLGLSQEINRLKDDLVLEGWHVVAKFVPRAEQFNKDAMAVVKQIVKDESSANMHIFIIGRVPVPYSGNFNPDAHPDHLGAWPADLYYGDNNNFWSDNQINNSTSGRAENRNIPGDGKFDQSQLSTNIEYPVGRIDFYNMPAFTATELDLLKQYLNRNHDYRTGAFKPLSKCYVDDNFGGYIEGFATSGWRLSPLVGNNNISEGDFFSSLLTETLYWAYGTGGGTYSSAGGIGSTSDFVSKKVNGVFSMLFGSYFGDWDSQNNFLRAPLATNPPILTCSWAGRPQWYYHHMGMGLPVGFSTLTTQNNYSTYLSNYLYPLAYPNGVVYSIGQKQVHQALLGDPTLAMFMSDATTSKNLSVSQSAGKPVSIYWDQVFDDNIGYNLYKSTNGYYGPFVKVNNELINDIKYTDEDLFEGEVFYMLRTVKLTETPSGSYQNESRGIVKSMVVTSVVDNINDISVSCNPNPATDNLKIQFTVPQDLLLRIDITDIHGNFIKSLRNDYVQRGNYDVTWDLVSDNGIKVSSGMYFINFNFGTEQVMQMISVIR